RAEGRAKEPAAPESANPIVAFVESFGTFLAKPKVVLVIAFLIVFKAGDALLFNMSVPFLDRLGFDLHMRGRLNALSLVTSIAGTTIGGMWIRRSSLARTLVPVAVMQALAIPIYTLLAEAHPRTEIVAASVAVEQFIAGIGNAALLVFLMRRAE